MAASASHPLDNHFRQLWHSFIATYGGLRLFSEQLPELADRLDEQTIEELAKVMADIFGDPLEQVRAELHEFLPLLDEDHLYPDFSNQPDVRDAFAAFHDTAFRRRVLKWERENPRKKHKLLTAWTDYMAQPPLSGIVLRQSTLINLVSALEIFVDGVIKIYQEQIAPQHVIKERPTWKDRWDALRKIAPSPLWQPYRDPLREMIARRNALIHQGGRITAEGYLKQTEEVATLRPDKATEGRFLLVPTTYLQQAFDRVILFAFALSQSAWREWRKPHHPKTADGLASDFIYQTLRQKRYALVENLAQLALKLETEWEYTQLIQVNQAIAFREQNKTEDLHQVLSQLEKRKKRRWKIKIAVHILRQRFEQAHTLLKTAAEQGKLGPIFPYWPLFDPIRQEAWFKNLFDAADNAPPRPRKKHRP